MKTAISIPDDLYETAEQYAKGRGLSRSELYATALRRYLEECRRDSITEQLNAVYGEISSELDPVLARIQALSLPKEEWE